MTENPRLIIIDTLARIKPRQGKKAGTAYDLDNELLNKLRLLLFKKYNDSFCYSLIKTIYRLFMGPNTRFSWNARYDRCHVVN